MDGTRKPPDFYPADSLWCLSTGIFAILVGLAFLIGPMFVEKKGLFDFVRYLWLIILDLLIFALGFFTLSIGLTRNREKKKWLKTTAATAATIIECIKEDVWDQNYFDTVRWVIKITMQCSQAKGNPDHINAQVYISESQYKKYINKKSVKVYYSREDPFVFLLEDEV